MAGDSSLGLSLEKSSGSLALVNISRLLETAENFLLYLSLTKLVLFMILFFTGLVLPF